MNITGEQIIQEANNGNWSFFETPFEHSGLTIDLDWAIETAALNVAMDLQQDEGYAGLDPETAYDTLAEQDAASTDSRERERAIAMLRYDRVHKGY